MIVSPHEEIAAVPAVQPHNPAPPVLQVDRLSVQYDGATALDDVSFSVPTADRVAVVGPNGAGKSTLFKAILGLLPVAAGTIRVNTSGVAPSVAYVAQRSAVDWTFPVSVADVVLMGRVGRRGFWRRPNRHDRSIAQECLARVGLHDLARRQIGALSGGQQQRVFIARALAQQPRLLLMDEPLTGLDVAAQEDILRIIAELRTQDVTVLVATHDLNQAADPRHFEQVLLLKRRLIGAGSARNVFTPQNLAATYGGHLRWVTTADGTLLLADTCCSRGVEP